MIRTIVIPVVINGSGAPLPAGFAQDVADQIVKATGAFSAAPAEVHAVPPIAVAREHVIVDGAEAFSDVTAFIAERCHLGPRRWVCVGTLYRDYENWSEARNRRALSRYLFCESLMARGFEQRRTRRVEERQCRTWEGLGLVGDNPPRPSPPASQSQFESLREKLRDVLTALEETGK